MSITQSNFKDAKAEYFAPGRVNLIGEHIDYNGGYVLPFAIDRGIYLSVSSSSKWRFTSEHFTSIFEAERLEEFTVKQSQWYDFLLGVVQYFISKGFELSPLHIHITSNLPLGAGLSSSAAISVAGVMAIGDLLEIKFTENEIALIARQVENDFVGVSCGIMDQMASAYGKHDSALLLNCQSLEKRYIPLNLGSYELVISHTGKSRILTDTWFNTRQQECQTALKFAQKFYDIDALCQLEHADLFHEIKAPWGKRAIHVIEENTRVINAANSLESNNLEDLALNMNLSHDSLRDNYEVTGTELDCIVEEARKIDGVIAARMSGAGFGGCSINLVHKDALEDFYQKLKDSYTKITGLPIEFYLANSGIGAHRFK